MLGGDLTKLRERYGVTASRTKEGASLAFTPKDAKVAKVVRRIAVNLRPRISSPQRGSCWRSRATIARRSRGTAARMGASPSIPRGCARRSRSGEDGRVARDLAVAIEDTAEIGWRKATPGIVAR